MINKLKNAGNEKEWAGNRSLNICSKTHQDLTQTRDSIHTPEDWRCFFNNDPGYGQPEVRDAWATMDPRRAMNTKSVLGFNFFRKGSHGMEQQVPVTPGAWIHAGGFVQGWSNGMGSGTPHLDDPFWSEGEPAVGYKVVSLREISIPPLSTKPDADKTYLDKQSDGIGNMRFAVGIDPTGGTNPYSSSVKWGATICAYNGFFPLPEVRVQAQASTVTFFVMVNTMWAYKHNDSYFGDMYLYEEDSDEEPPDPPTGDTNCKMGLHMLRNAPGVEEALDAGPAIAVFDTDLGLSAQAPDGTLCIGTISHTSYDVQSLQKAGMSPEAAAAFWIQQDVDKYLANPRITHWCGSNEPVMTTLEEMAWFSQFEIERIQMLKDLGLFAIIGEWSTGCPPLELWPAFVPALRYGADHGALLGLHEYSCPWMWWMTGTYQLDLNEDQGDEGWSTLRYRKVQRQILEPNNINIQMVITEAGIDPRSDPKPVGCPSEPWTGLGPYWLEHNQEADPEAFYFRQLVWYDEELCKDPYVVGWALFCGGNYGGPWADFDVAGTQVIVDMTQRIANRTSTPVPDDDIRRFEFVIHVGPQDITDAEMDIIREAAREGKQTIALSLDHAAMGNNHPNVTKSIIHVWGADRIAGSRLDLEAWMLLYYPPLPTIIYHEFYEDSPPYEPGPLRLTYPSTYYPPFVVQGFHSGHGGIDLRGSWPFYGTKILAALPGIIKNAGWSNTFGNYLLIATDLPDGRRAELRYAHLEVPSQLAAGELVSRGQELGLCGGTAIPEVPDHLHFSVWLAGAYVDPAPLIDWPTAPPVEPPSSIRGVHSAPITSPPNDRGYWLAEMQAMGIKWYKDMSMDIGWCATLLNAGIEPVVRLFMPQQFPNPLSQELLSKAATLIDAGVTYFEIGNEPNLPNEWGEYADSVDWHNEQRVAGVAEAWVHDAKIILNMGGKPGIYAMAPTEREGGCNEKYSSTQWLYLYMIEVRNRSEQWLYDDIDAGRIWQATHVSPFNRPFDYDPQTNGVHFDDMCLHAFDVYTEIVQDAINRIPKIINTEGGMYSPEHLADLSWAPYTEEHWAEQMPKMFTYIEEHFPNVIGVCPWILTDQDVGDTRWHNNGWFRGIQPRGLVEKMKI